MSYHRPSHSMEQTPARLLKDPRYNKGTAFGKKERTLLCLDGLLPGKVEGIETQLKRCMKQLTSFESNMGKYIYMSSLKERNETLFYALLINHMEELMPIVYTPTVGQACLEFGTQYRAAEGMYFSKNDRGHIRDMLDNWAPNHKDEVSIVVVTDGSRILGLGDLGANGMGIPIGKLSLYVAAGGFHPAATLPVVLDTGTNNEALLEDELYLGERYKRLHDDEYYPLVAEFMSAVKEKWPLALVQFEDFSNNHCFKLLDDYRHKNLCFNDDVQGTGAVIAAGFLNALKITKTKVNELRVVFLGAGAAAIGVADQISRSLSERYGGSADSYRRCFYLIDSKGLVTLHRGDQLAPSKVTWARDDIKEKMVELDDIIDLVKPHALIGLSGIPNQFTQSVIAKMAKMNDRPIIFPLSNPTKNSECTAQEAYEGTRGRCVFASGSPFPRLEVDGKEYVPSQGNNMYVFPGLGFGSWLAQASEVSDEMITAATLALADMVTPAELAKGQIYPGLSRVRDVSAQIATAVCATAVSQGLSRASLPRSNLLAFVKGSMYTSEYLPLE